MLSTFVVFVAVVEHAHHDEKDFPCFRRIGYSLGWSRRSQALAYYG
jgi:hypothetical protein